MNTHRIRQKVIKRQAEKNKEYLYFGDILKRKRLELGLTQESLCKGFVSDSYFSKVENNKLLPNHGFVEEVSERLNINLQTFFPGSGKKNLYDRITHALFYADVKELHALFESIQELNHSVTEDLIQLTIAVLTNQHSIQDRLIKSLEPLVNTMPDETTALFLNLSAMSLYQQSNFIGCVELLTACETIHNIPETLRTNEQIYLYLAKHFLGLVKGSAEHYQRAIMNLTDFHYEDKLLELRLYEAYFMVEESPECARKAILKIHQRSVPQTLLNFYRYIHANIAYHLNQLNESETYLESLDVEQKNIWFYKSIGLKSLINKQKGKIDPTLAPYFDDVEHDAHSLLEKVAFTLQHMENPETRKQYLKDFALPLAIKSQCIKSMNLYTEELITLLEAGARYKDALACMKKRDKILLKLRNISG